MLHPVPSRGLGDCWESVTSAWSLLRGASVLGLRFMGPAVGGVGGSGREPRHLLVAVLAYRRVLARGQTQRRRRSRARQRG